MYGRTSFSTIIALLLVLNGFPLLTFFFLTPCNVLAEKGGPNKGEETNETLVGDWIIENNDDVYYGNRTICMKGRIRVFGNLTLRNVTIIFQCTYNAQYGICIETGGSLYLTDIDKNGSSEEDGCKFTVSNPLYNHHFRVNESTNFTMEYSSIHYCGAPGAPKNYGLYIRGENGTINGSRIKYGFFGVYLDNAKNCVVDNSVFSSNRYGINTGGLASGNIITNNSIHSNLNYGIKSFQSNIAGNHIIKNNYIKDNSRGISLDCTNVTIHNNTMINNSIDFSSSSFSRSNSHYIDTTNSVNGKPVYYWKNVDGGVVPGNAGQVILANCSNVTVEKQNITHGGYGIILFYSYECEVRNNIIYDGFNVGIYLRQSYRTSVKNNSFNGNKWGSHIFKSHNITFIGNNCSNNSEDGIYFDNSRDCTILDNTCYYNMENGIELQTEINVTVDNNTCNFNIESGIRLNGNLWVDDFNTVSNNTCIKNEENGIYLRGSASRNLIQRNLLISNKDYGIRIYHLCNENTFALNEIIYNGVKVHYSWNNSWNNTDQKGNFWSDYHIRYPASTHNGVTWNTPYSISGSSPDWHPLMFVSFPDDQIPVILDDDTPGNPTTGDPLEFSLNVSDNFLVIQVRVNYTYDNNTYQNMSLAIAYDQTWKGSITIDPFASGIDYRVTALDAGNNTVTTNWTFLAVTDNDGPIMIGDKSDTVASTGEDFKISVEFNDPNGVNQIRLNYTCNDLDFFNVSMNNTGGMWWNGTYSVPSWATFFKYCFFGEDNLGNVDISALINISVMDNDPPTFIKDNNIDAPTTGDNYSFSANFTDNIDVVAVELNFTFNGVDYRNISMNHYYGERWDINISVPSSASFIMYYYNYSDSAGNNDSIPVKNISVRDDDPPVLLNDFSDTTGTTGDLFEFNITAIDNILVDGVYVNWSHGDIFENISLFFSGNQWNGVVELGNNISRMSYVIYIRDISNNFNISSPKLVNIDDNDLPTIIFDWTPRTGTTGDKLEFNVTANDNVEVASVHVKWMHGISSENISLIQNGEFWIQTIIVLDVIENLSYQIIISDTSENQNISKRQYVRIIDNDLPEILMDYSMKNGTTGDPFNFKMIATDNIGVEEVFVKSAFPGDDETISLERQDFYWICTIIIGDFIGFFNYTIHVRDAEGNENSTSERCVYVFDNDLPELMKDLTCESAGTGEDFHFVADFTDNIGVTRVNVIYSIDLAEPYNESMMKVNESRWITTRVTPLNSTSISYYFLFIDNANNTNHTSLHVVPVLDVSPPVLLNEETIGNTTTGDDFKFRIELDDNIGILKSWINLSFDNHSFHVIDLDWEGEQNWSLTITIPINAIKIYYYYHALDFSLNEIQSDLRTLNVWDNDAPMLIEENAVEVPNYPYMFNFSAIVKDNIGIDGVYLNITYNGIQWERKEMKIVGSDTWLMSIIVDTSLAEMSYIIHFSDFAGNWNSSSRGQVIIPDHQAPVADLGGDVMIDGGTEYFFNASMSHDNIGIVLYDWMFEYNGSLVSLLGESTSFLFDLPGNYSVTLTVRDESGNIVKDMMTITVRDIPAGGGSNGGNGGEEPGNINDTVPETQSNLAFILCIIIPIVLLVMLVITFVIIVLLKKKKVTLDESQDRDRSVKSEVNDVTEMSGETSIESPEKSQEIFQVEEYDTKKAGMDISLAPEPSVICPKCDEQAHFYADYECFWCENCQDYVFPGENASISDEGASLHEDVIETKSFSISGSDKAREGVSGEQFEEEFSEEMKKNRWATDSISEIIMNDCGLFTDWMDFKEGHYVYDVSDDGNEEKNDV